MRFKFYKTTEDAWKGMLKAIEGAGRSIHIEQYIFNPDDAGLPFITALREKAKQGVEVKIIADAVGSHGLFLSPLVEEIRNDGIDIVFFNTFFIGRAGYYTTWFFRDHAKLMIVDGYRGFTGGICIKEEMRDWRDTHVEVEGGSVVEEMEQVFKRMWRRAEKKRYRKTIVLPDRTGVEYLMNVPLPRQRHLYYHLIAALRNAERSIYLTTPYFVPDRRLFRILCLAARQNVKVHLLLPYISDYAYMDHAAQSYFTQALRSGIHIYRYRGEMIHAKTAVIDDTWATVGSLNLDNVSLRYNFEANVVATDAEFVHEVKSHFLEDIKRAEEVTLPEWELRSWHQKLFNILIKPFRFAL